MSTDKWKQHSFANSLGLVGAQINYSLSPFLHNTTAAKLGRDNHYQLFNLKPNEINSFLDQFWRANGLGLNITTPYKQIVAKKIGSRLASVNTLVRGRNGWIGLSTDGPAFELGINRMHKPLSDFTQLIFLGGGGVVSSILKHFKDSNFRADIDIFRRNSHNDPTLQSQCQAKISFHPFCSTVFANVLHKIKLQGSEHTLVIQATSAPNHGESLSKFSSCLEGFQGTFADLIYNTHCALGVKAIKEGITCQDGLPMFIEQARLSQMAWWGQTLPYKTLLDHASSQLQRD